MLLHFTYRSSAYRALLSLPVMLSVLPQAMAGTLSLSAGMHYLKGRYDDSLDTRIYYYPLQVRYDTQRFRYTVTLPYLKMSGPNSVVAGRGAIQRSTNTNPEQQSASGIGDVIARIGYKIQRPLSLPDDSRLWFDVSAAIKIPSADEDKGLGTGSPDSSIQLDVFNSREGFTPFLTLGYKQRGDLHVQEVTGGSGGNQPAQVVDRQVSLSNGYFASLGWSARTSPSVSWGLSLDIRESANEGENAEQEVLCFTSLRFDQHWRSNAYLGTGLNENSADLLTGISLQYRF